MCILFTVLEIAVLYFWYRSLYSPGNYWRNHIVSWLVPNMAVLTEEVGELARVIARKYGDQSFKAGEKENLGDEMADVLWVLLCLANQTGVDLTEELKKNIAKKTKRDSQRHIQNEKLK